MGVKRVEKLLAKVKDLLYEGSPVRTENVIPERINSAIP